MAVVFEGTEGNEEDADADADGEEEDQEGENYNSSPAELQLRLVCPIDEDRSIPVIEILCRLRLKAFGI